MSHRCARRCGDKAVELSNDATVDSRVAGLREILKFRLLVPQRRTGSKPARRR